MVRTGVRDVYILHLAARWLEWPHLKQCPAKWFCISSTRPFPWVFKYGLLVGHGATKVKRPSLDFDLSLFLGPSLSRDLSRPLSCPFCPVLLWFWFCLLSCPGFLPCFFGFGFPLPLFVWGWAFVIFASIVAKAVSKAWTWYGLLQEPRLA